MIFNFLFIAMIYLFISPQKVNAYLDPGTGSLLIQLLIGSVLGSLYFTKLYWSKLVKIFTFLMKKYSNEKKKTDKKE